MKFLYIYLSWYLVSCRSIIFLACPFPCNIHICCSSRGRNENLHPGNEVLCSLVALRGTCFTPANGGVEFWCEKRLQPHQNKILRHTNYKSHKVSVPWLFTRPCSFEREFNFRLVFVVKCLWISWEVYIRTSRPSICLSVFSVCKNSNSVRELLTNFYFWMIIRLNVIIKANHDTTPT
jgi:hypothetical protein